MDKLVHLDKVSDFGEYIGKSCIKDGRNGIIVGYTHILNLFIIGLFEVYPNHSWECYCDENLHYDIINPEDDIILVHSPIIKAYCYAGSVLIEK